MGRIGIYQVEEAKNTQMVVRFLLGLANWFEERGHQTEIIKLDMNLTFSENKARFKDCDHFVCYCNNWGEIELGGKRLFLHSPFCQQPWKMFLFLPIPLLSRPELVLGLMRNYPCQRYFYFDSNFPRHYEIVFGAAPAAQRMDALPVVAGVKMPTTDIPNRPPRIYFAARIKGGFKLPHRFEKQRVITCIERLSRELLADPLIVVSEIFQEDPVVLAKDNDYIELLAYVIMQAANVQRGRLIKVLCGLPVTIYCSRVDFTGVQLHRNCVIHAPIDDIDFYKSIEPGDVVICPPVWCMQNFLTERCTTSLYRGAIPLIPGSGGHDKLFRQLGMEKAFYDLAHPESLKDAIGRVLDGEIDREALSWRGRNHASQNFSVENTYRMIGEAVIDDLDYQ